MNDNKNMVLAVVLSALVLLGWSFLSPRLFPTANPPVAKIENGNVKPLSQPHASPAGPKREALRGRQTVLRSTPRVRIDTPSLEGSINLTGAMIDDLVLVRERETIAKDSPPDHEPVFAARTSLHLPEPHHDVAE